MSLYTKRDDLEKLFQEYGKVERVNIVMDRHVNNNYYIGLTFLPFMYCVDWKIERLWIRLL